MSSLAQVATTMLRATMNVAGATVRHHWHWLALAFRHPRQSRTALASGEWNR